MASARTSRSDRSLKFRANFEISKPLASDGSRTNSVTMKTDMRIEASDQGDSTLDSVRRRGQIYLGYLLWIFMILGLLWAANVFVTLVDQAIDVLRKLRGAAGFTAPANGPDVWVLTGIAALALVAGAVILLAYAAYRASWNRRLA